MMSITHIIAGISCARLMQHGAMLPPSPMILAAAAFGALLPDLDHPSSMLGRRVKPLSWLLSTTTGHRGMTHSCFMVAVLLFGAAQLPPAWHALMLGVIAGHASHLMADMLTPAGVPLVWPWRARFRFPITMRTNSKWERLFRYLMAIGLCYDGINSVSQLLT